MTEDIKTKLITAIREKNDTAINEILPTQEAIAEYRDEKTGDNIFHILAREGNSDFVKAFFEKHTKDLTGFIVKELLLTPNNDGEIPCNLYENDADIKTAQRRPRLDEVISKKNHRKNHIFLKRMTKEYYYGIYQTGELYDNGKYFSLALPKQGMMTSSSERYYGTMEALAYPSITLVNRHYDHDGQKGLAADSNSTTFINSKIHEKYMAEGNEIEGFNCGEFVRVSITGNAANTGTVLLDADLRKTAENNMPFIKKDFACQLDMLELLGKEIKAGMNSDIYLPIYQYFIKNGGTFIIEDKNEQYCNSNSKDSNSVSLGSSTKSVKGRSQTSFISMQPSYIAIINAGLANCVSKENFRNTIRHELTHLCDNNFSASPIFAKFIMMEVAQNGNNKIKQDMITIARGYKESSLKRELLANIMGSSGTKDKMTAATVKLFSAYVEAASTDNAKYAEEIIKTPVDDITDEESFIKKALEITEVMKNVTANSKLANNSEYRDTKSQLKKKLNGGASEEDVIAVYNETKEKITANPRIKDINALLKEELNTYTEKDTSPLQLFKIGILYTELRKKAHPHFMTHYDVHLHFNSPESFNYIKNGEYHTESANAYNRYLFRDAVKLSRIVSSNGGHAHPPFTCGAKAEQPKKEKTPAKAAEFMYPVKSYGRQ